MKQKRAPDVSPPVNTRTPRLTLALTAVFAVGGCTFPSSTTVVPARQANQLQVAEVGTVVKVRDVAIEGRRTQVGQFGGAVIGGAAASPSGGVNTTGEKLGVAAASVAGAVVGEATEEYLTRQQAQEITVQMKNGDLVVVVQEVPPNYQVGDEVHVIHGPGGARVAMGREI